MHKTETAYKVTCCGRWFVLIIGITLYGAGLRMLYIASLFLTDGTPFVWQLYVLAAILICFCLGWGIHTLLLGIQQIPRVVVDNDGVLYNGALKSTRFEWRDIVTLKQRTVSRGISNLDLTVKTQNGLTNRVLLNFTDLNPDRTAFVNQARLLAPWVVVE